MVSLPTAGEKVSANDGKTELSLLHFMATNPDWKPPAGSARFVSEFKNRVCFLICYDGFSRALLFLYFEYFLNVLRVFFFR